MPKDKVFSSFAEAVADIPDGAAILLDGFGSQGSMPSYLIEALRNHGAKDLTLISNSAGLTGFGARPGETFIDPSILFENRQVKKVIASFPAARSPSNPNSFERAYRRGEVELEVVPQGTLAERIRAGGAGLGGFYTPTGVGTMIERGKEKKTINGKEYILELPIKGDFALIRAHKADKMGNLVYSGTSRNFNAVMAPAARVTIVEVDEIVEIGELDPEAIVTPGIFVHRIVQRPRE